MSFSDCLIKLDEKINLGINRSLDRVQEALHILGSPQKIFKSIHIAGTNGKGSTVSMISTILCHAGYRVGLTLSPHMNSVRERIQINGLPIQPGQFADLFNLIESKCAAIKLTYFEFIIVMAFVWFAENKVDIAVVETGLGGRLDATNVLHPIAGGITNVAKDHQEFLGDTLDSILEEKSQIAKPGMHFWTAIEEPELKEKLKSYCDSVGAIYYHVDDYFKFEKDHLVSLNTNLITKPGLEGMHQLRNAAMAHGVVQCLNNSGFIVPELSIREGVAKTKWPGRLEWLSEYPHILLDGAHNEGGIKMLRSYLEAHKIKGSFIFGCLQNRNMVELISPLLPFVKGKLFLALFDHEKAYTVDQLLIVKNDLQNKENLMVEILNLQEKSWYSDSCCDTLSDPLVITGSLYMVAQIRHYLLGGDS